MTIAEEIAITDDLIRNSEALLPQFADKKSLELTIAALKKYRKRLEEEAKAEQQ